MIGTEASPLERNLHLRLLLALAGVLLVVVIGLASPARAQTGGGYPITTEPTVLPSTTLRGSTTTSDTGGRTLPVTGGDVLGLTAIGIGLVGTGFVVLKARDRRTQTA